MMNNWSPVYNSNLSDIRNGKRNITNTDAPNKASFTIQKSLTERFAGVVESSSKGVKRKSLKNSSSYVNTCNFKFIILNSKQ